MAKTRVNGTGGGVTFPSGVNMDSMSWDLDISQQVDDTSNYNDPAGFGSANGSGTLNGRFTINGIIAANATGTTPGMVSFTSGGGTYTLTAAAGCTYGFTGIIETYRLQHRKIAGAQGTTVSGRTTGTITETWATS